MLPNATRSNELNYDINLAYTQSRNNPTMLQLQHNQAYAKSRKLPQNSDESIYKIPSDLSSKYAQVLTLEGDREEGVVLQTNPLLMSDYSNYSEPINEHADWTAIVLKRNIKHSNSYFVTLPVDIL